MASVVHSRSHNIYTQWTLIQDIIGPAHLWPSNIRYLFWKKNLVHFERIITCAFVWVNGLNPDTFIEWVVLMHLTDDIDHIRALFVYFEQGHYGKALYGYCVAQNMYQYLDGTPRMYVHRSHRN